MIQDFDSRNLRNAGYIQFITNVTLITNTFDTTALQINTQADSLSALAVQLDGVFNKQRGSDITPELEQLDRRRDFAIIGLRAVLEGNEYHADTKKKEAATMLLAHLRSYGDKIYQLSYPEETTVVRNIINDWETQEALKNALMVLAVTDWKNELQQSNTDFEQKYLARNKELASVNAISVSELRKEVNEHYKTLKAHINSHAILHPSEAYTALVNQINTLIDQNKQMLENRASRKKNEEQGTDGTLVS